MSAAPESDAVAEALRLLERASADGLVVRALGGVAIALALGGDLNVRFARTYRDIDLIVERGSVPGLTALLEDFGYRSDAEFNQLHGATRMLFHDEPRKRQLDVFVDAFSMCHAIPFTGRLGMRPLTVPLPELLLTKLQIVKLNEKDRDDVYGLLLACPVGVDGIDAERLADVCRRDWGLCHTVRSNLERLTAQLPGLGLEEEGRARIADRIAAIDTALETAPKTPSWRMRARLGTRVRWYDEPEEVELV